jgi:hypothetical protein
MLLGYLSTPRTVYRVDSNTPLLLPDATSLTAVRHPGYCLHFHVRPRDSADEAAGVQFLVQAGTWAAS